MEAWYVSLAASAETMPKIHKGKGLGPAKIPAFGDISLNKYLEIGQRMWFKALKHLKGAAPTATIPDSYVPPGVSDQDTGNVGEDVGEVQNEFNETPRCDCD